MGHQPLLPVLIKRDPMPTSGAGEPDDADQVALALGGDGDEWLLTTGLRPSDVVAPGERVVWLEVFGFNGYNRLRTLVLCIVLDSGAIADEFSILDFRAVASRRSSSVQG